MTKIKLNWAYAKGELDTDTLFQEVKKRLRILFTVRVFVIAQIKVTTQSCKLMTLQTIMPCWNLHG